MENFVLENQTKIIFGKDTIEKIGSETIQYGKKILLIYGKQSIKQNGIYNKVISSLQQAGATKIVEHAGVRSNPVLSHVRTGIELAKQQNIEVIVAVGGGSVIDSAKAIGAGALVDHDVWKFFTGKKGIKKCLPITTVLTLAASASEMNGGMVITNEKNGHKLGTGNKKINPRVSILDPTATFSVPKNYSAFGAIDAIAHILEFYCTCQLPYTPVQDRFMEGLIINIMESCEQVLADQEDYQARANLMWCATMALNGWTSAGLGMVGFPMHMIEHALSALYDVPHGAGLSIVVPGWLRWHSRYKPEKMNQIAQRVFNVTSEDPELGAIAGVEKLKSWFSKVGGPTSLAELGISEKDIPIIAENSLTQAKLWRLRQYNLQTVMEILKKTVR